MSSEIAIYFFCYDQTADYWWWAKRPQEYKVGKYDHMECKYKEEIIQIKDGLNSMPKRFRDAVLLLSTMN
jgi:hypothetical protein